MISKEFFDNVDKAFALMKSDSKDYYLKIELDTRDLKASKNLNQITKNFFHNILLCKEDIERDLKEQEAVNA